MSVSDVFPLLAGLFLFFFFFFLGGWSIQLLRLFWETVSSSGGLTPFFFSGVGRQGGKSVSQRCLPAIGRLFFLFLVDSAFAFVLVRGLTPFFFKCHHPAFDWDGKLFFFLGGVRWDGK